MPLALALASIELLTARAPNRSGSLLACAATLLAVARFLTMMMRAFTASPYCMSKASCNS